MTEWMILCEKNERIHLVKLEDASKKHKGLGVFNSQKMLENIQIGEEILLGQKYLTRLPVRLPELIGGMKRRAQTISLKDSGALIARLGIGAGDKVLDAGLGSAGLSMHLATVLGKNGILVTVEAREEHAEVGLHNLKVAKECLKEFPTHHHLTGFVEHVIEQSPVDLFDAIILDMPEHEAAIRTCVEKLAFGARLACYAPNTSQLEACWKVCKDVNLHIDWCAEVIERPWGQTSKGGMRPTKGLFGHTAFLLIAVRR